MSEYQLMPDGASVHHETDVDDFSLRETEKHLLEALQRVRRMLATVQELRKRKSQQLDQKDKEWIDNIAIAPASTVVFETQPYYAGGDLLQFTSACQIKEHDINRVSRALHTAFVMISNRAGSVISSLPGDRAQGVNFSSEDTGEAPPSYLNMDHMPYTAEDFGSTQSLPTPSKPTTVETAGEHYGYAALHNTRPGDNKPVELSAVASPRVSRIMSPSYEQQNEADLYHRSGLLRRSSLSGHALDNAISTDLSELPAERMSMEVRAPMFPILDPRATEMVQKPQNITGKPSNGFNGANAEAYGPISLLSDRTLSEDNTSEVIEYAKDSGLIEVYGGASRPPASRPTSSRRSGYSWLERRANSHNLRRQGP